MTTPPLIEGRRLSKSYAGVPVVRDVDVQVNAHEVHAVVGENGAGKSTLMKMLAGITRPDDGEIRMDGVARELKSPRQAARAGIGIVHQELHLVPLQSVADNLMLSRPPGARSVRRASRAERVYVNMVLERVGLRVDPDARVSTLSTPQRQLLEIAKALALNPRVIVFDEPTACLLPHDAARLLGLIETLKAEGHGILFISHALEDVLRLANRITVLRDGRRVATLDRSEADRGTLIAAMVDRPIGTRAPAPPALGADVVLSAQSVANRNVRDVTFALRSGEILGFAGLMGSGMQEAAMALSGASAIDHGALAVGGQSVRFTSPRDALSMGIVLVPEERKSDGIIPELSVCENLHVGRYGRYATWGFIRPARLRTAATALAHRFHIRASSIDQPINTLSGGNQQKALIARCVQSNPRVLVLCAPTRGVDVAAKDTIHQIVLELARNGTAVIVASPDLEEALALSHRIAVFSQGRMVGILPRSEATPARIMELAFASRSSSEMQ